VLPRQYYLAAGKALACMRDGHRSRDRVSLGVFFRFVSVDTFPFPTLIAMLDTTGNHSLRFSSRDRRPWWSDRVCVFHPLAGRCMCDRFRSCHWTSHHVSRWLPILHVREMAPCMLCSFLDLREEAHDLTDLCAPVYGILDVTGTG